MAERRNTDRRRGERRDNQTVRPTYADVSLASLGHNLGAVRTLVGDRCRILAVVKADAYGHGAVASARALLDAGAWGLAVSLTEEGVELREAGIHGPIIVLGGVYPGSQDVLVHRRLTPVVWTATHIDLLAAAVRRAGASALPVHLKVDTGMSRLGARPEGLSEVLDALSDSVADGDLRFEGCLTHLAGADDPDSDDQSTAQLAAFDDALQTIAGRGLRPEIRHVCNSAGVVRLPAAHFDMVRPGGALYGIAASRAVAVDGTEASMTLRSRVLGVRELPAGARMSYGGTYTLTRPSRVALVPVGYGDGYPRSLQGAHMLVRGHPCPLLGTVTMDTVMVDVTDLPDVREGEAVVVLGPMGRTAVTAFDLADWSQTITYEITCGISKRVPRRRG